MPITLEGGCQCGAVRYSITGEYRTTYACHCTICQRASGSAFGMALIVVDPVVRWLAAPPSTYERTGREGRNMRSTFCASCSSRLTHQFFTAAGDAPFVSVRPGTLDDTSWVVPEFHVWTQHKQPWIQFAEGDEVWPQAMPAERVQSYMQRRRGEDA